MDLAGNRASFLALRTPKVSGVDGEVHLVGGVGGASERPARPSDGPGHVLLACGGKRGGRSWNPLSLGAVM